MKSHKDIEENIKVLETISASELSSVDELISAREVVYTDELKDVSETFDNAKLKNNSDKKVNNDVRNKLLSFNLLSTAGLISAAGIIIATSAGLINYQMSSTFTDFYYEDGKVSYSLEFNNLDVSKDNTLSIQVHEEKDELVEYKLIYDYDTVVIDKNIRSIKKLKDCGIEEDLIIDESHSLSSYLRDMKDGEAISYTYFMNENDITYYESTILMNKGLKGEIKGYFTINMDRIVEELSQDGEFMHYYATLKGSTGLLDRTFDRMAVKVTALISEFNSLSGECHCVTRSADGTYHLKLDYKDDYGYFNFQDIYMKDINGNESGHITESSNWHDEMKIPVLNLSGSAEIHIIYIDTSINKKVELIFKDGSKDVFVRYDDGIEEIFKSFEEEFDIKV
ncbi:hypothetical protein IKQ02_03425 [bacterium]|nr:hypothetical protein [bacterium]